MTTLNESSRRAFLTAIAASGSAAAVVAAPGTVHASDEPGGAGTNGPGGGVTPSVSRTQAFPVPTPGTRYTYVQGDEFHPLVSSSAYSKSFLEVRATINAIFFASLAGLPNGAQITEVTFAVVKSVSFPGFGSYLMYQATSGDLELLASRDNAALPQQTAEQFVSLVVDPTNPAWVVDNEQASTPQLVINITNSRVNSVRVGWVPGPTTPLSFVPISPKRAYDSRFVAPLGPLPNNSNRVISVANSYVTGMGTLEQANIIPATARAIAYNLTIANTVGQGFLSVNPGNAVAPGGSSINWFTSGLSLANGLVVSLDNNRQVNVFGGGGGTTDFIIDVLGYYL